MLLKITHKTRLDYTCEVEGTIFEARMAPRSDDDQTTHWYQLTSTPNAPLTSYRDGDGNRVDLFNIFNPYTSLTVQADSYVRTHRRDSSARLKDETTFVKSGDVIGLELREFLKPSALILNGEKLRQFADSIYWPDWETGTGRAQRLMDALGGRLNYESAVTHAWSSVEEVLSLNVGVCQDFAHVLIGLARLKGLPARYVSGYINQPGQIATHAWAQVWFGPRAGWIDMDPTRGIFATDDHVTVAFGRDYSDVPPNRGLWVGNAVESIDVIVEISQVDRLPADISDFSPRKSHYAGHHRRFSRAASFPQNAQATSATRALLAGSLPRQPFQPENHPQQTQQQQ